MIKSFVRLNKKNKIFLEMIHWCTMYTMYIVHQPIVRLYIKWTLTKQVTYATRTIRIQYYSSINLKKWIFALLETYTQTINSCSIRDSLIENYNAADLQFAVIHPIRSNRNDLTIKMKKKKFNKFFQMNRSCERN